MMSTIVACAAAFLRQSALRSHLILGLKFETVNWTSMPAVPCNRSLTKRCLTFFFSLPVRAFGCMAVPLSFSSRRHDRLYHTPALSSPHSPSSTREYTSFSHSQTRTPQLPSAHADLRPCFVVIACTRKCEQDIRFYRNPSDVSRRTPPAVRFSELRTIPDHEDVAMA